MYIKRSEAFVFLFVGSRASASSTYRTMVNFGTWCIILSTVNNNEKENFTTPALRWTASAACFVLFVDEERLKHEQYLNTLLLLLVSRIRPSRDDLTALYCPCPPPSPPRLPPLPLALLFFRYQEVGMAAPRDSSTAAGGILA